MISDTTTQFNSEILANLTKFLGELQICTSAYNVRSGNWVDELAFVLQGIRMRPDGDGISAYSRVTSEKPIALHKVTEDVCMNDVVGWLNKVTFPCKQTATLKRNEALHLTIIAVM